MLVFLVHGRVMRPLGILEHAPYREHAVGGRRDHGAVVKVERPPPARGVIVVGFVKGSPRRIVTVPEGATGDVEFVAHHEVVGGAVDETRGRAEAGGGVLVDPTGAREGGR